MNLKELQTKYPKFRYSDYSYKISGNNLKISFLFKIEPDIVFNPEIVIENIPKEYNDKGFENLVFNLGLIEMISYWKSTASLEIEVECGKLDEDQVHFFQWVILNGMGQYFYENKIKPFSPKITSKGKELEMDTNKKSERYLIPIGGGKDSAVTLEILKQKEKINCFSLNPTSAALKIMEIGECKNPIIVKRIIDNNLLELNRKGFLNGHTPFSAYLAFLTVLVAKMFDFKYIALSNEKSSEEGNVEYMGLTINHQWSKSYLFEKGFRHYCRSYLSKEIEYFSFLRMFYELQIASMFSKYPKYFPAFMSCNEAYKTDSGRKKPTGKWCGKCSKCLFAFLMLYPFLDKKVMIDIFGSNLFEDESLIPILEELIGKREVKPLECVGTRKESMVALNISWEKNKIVERDKQPALLKYFEEEILTKEK